VKTVVVAPFSNSPIRDWPLQNYGELVDLLLSDRDCRVLITGSGSQWAAANELVRGRPAVRVVNSCGYLTWAEVLDQVNKADCVVANNSGVAHVAAALGRPTICVFGASHSPYEWMPRGPAVILVTKWVVCGGCGFDVGGSCPYGVRCLTEISPEEIYRHCRGVLTPGEPLPLGASDAVREPVTTDLDQDVSELTTRVGTAFTQ